MKAGTADLVVRLLGRRNGWRLGRSLYMKARADSPNVARINGEEAVQRQLMARFAPTRDTLVAFDVGANVGDWTWFLLQEASRLNMEGRLAIHSFEPVPSTAKALQDRITGHPSGTSVHLCSVALSNEEGPIEMYVSGETAGTNSLHSDSMRHGQQSIRIDRTTADRYCSENEIPIVHYLKCDTEGHDVSVLLGARRMFDEQRVMACQFEYNHRWIYSRHYLKDVFDLFDGTDYAIGKITPGGVELYRAWHPELERFFESNYIVLHPEAVGWFTTIEGEYDSYNTFDARPARVTP